MWRWEAVCSARRRKYPLWTENTLFSWPLTANHQLLIEPVYQRCDSKWCCPFVLSRCLSQCTVNSQWLTTPSQALGSLHANRLSVYPLSASYLLHSSLLSLSPSISLSLSGFIILSLDAYKKRIGRKHTATGQCLLHWICWMFRSRKRRKYTFYPWSTISFI